MIMSQSVKLQLRLHDNDYTEVFGFFNCRYLCRCYLHIEPP